MTDTQNVIAPETVAGYTTAEWTKAKEICKQYCNAVICDNGCSTSYPGPGYGYFEVCLKEARAALHRLPTQSPMDQQEAINLLRRALDPFAIADTKIGRPLQGADYALAREAIQKTAAGTL